MTKIDQFESVFKSAERDPFVLEKVSFSQGLIVSDLDDTANSKLSAWLQLSIRKAMGTESSWSVLTCDESQSVDGLLKEVERHAPQLICTFRNLTRPLHEHPYSLGVFLDVLTQATAMPVLVVPRQNLESQFCAPKAIRDVMVITDHLAGQHHLVSIGASMTPPDGRLWLTHVEDKNTFDRYIETIRKIPEIDTDSAQKLIMDQLLKEPRDYIDSCRTNLAAAGEAFQVEKIATLGHRLYDYKQLVEEHRVDLLVLNTKDKDQLAMHGLAYPLSIELRNTPLFLL